jgi:acetyltransferase-like isoleucine patch superfamily enzyme
VEWDFKWIHEQIKIGNNVSIAQSVNIMTDSGPNASEEMQFFSLNQGASNNRESFLIGANSTYA